MFMGCRGSNPVTGPGATVSPASLTVVSGRTDQPIPSSELSVVPSRGGVTLSAGGYFNLTTAVRSTPISLWPADDGYLPASFTRALLYDRKDPGTLCRLPDGTTQVSLVPDSNLRAFQWAIDRLRMAADALSGHPALSFAVDGPGFPVQYQVNVADPVFTSVPNAAAAAYVTCGGDGIITAAKVVIKSLDIRSFWYIEDNFQIAMAHEGLHCTGVAHDDPSGEQGLMSSLVDAYAHKSPTAREFLVMKLQYLRRPGTRLAGMMEDETLVHQSSASAKPRVVCVR
jgi:hypothetical protein